MLSVVIPSYNEENLIHDASQVISKILQDNNIDYELVFVDDGSKDLTWQKIKEEHASNHKVNGISFSRNFGKEAAIFAGLVESKGDCVVVIDCDLQHPPEKIVEMYRLWEEGYQVVEGVKSSRGEESAMHKFASETFYKIISRATKIDMSNASDFKLLDRAVVNVLIHINEKNAFFRALSSWVGFKSTQVEYEVQERKSGESKWSTVSLIKYAITNISSYTSIPMQIVTFLGIITLIFTLVLSIRTLYQKIIGVALEGFTTIILLEGFIGSTLMISIGIIGYYISKIYEEVKGRPKFIIGDKTDDN